MDVEELEEQERELNKRIDSAVEMANNQLKRHKDKIQKVIEIQCRARSHPAYDDAAQRFLEDYAAWDEQRRFEEKIILGKIYDKKGNPIWVSKSYDYPTDCFPDAVQETTIIFEVDPTFRQSIADGVVVFGVGIDNDIFNSINAEIYETE